MSGGAGRGDGTGGTIKGQAADSYGNGSGEAAHRSVLAGGELGGGGQIDPEIFEQGAKDETS